MSVNLAPWQAEGERLLEPRSWRPVWGEEKERGEREEREREREREREKEREREIIHLLYRIVVRAK
jgi:hypothetical protein